MDFSKYTLLELHKIYFDLSSEIFKRMWWLIPIAMVVATLFLFYKNTKNK